MTKRWGVVGTALAMALWSIAAANALAVVHDFYTHTDRGVFTDVDDGEANIAYSLATQGRYSFPASPVLAGMSRMHGQFNYGPWYFYIAAGVIWLFGYSLTAVRSIHLWIIVGSAVAAAIWFRGGRDRAASGTVAGLGVLYFFSTTQWPMARPDSLVSAFAVVLVVASGLGMAKRHPVYWFAAGLAAACGAFTHLIAASMVGSALALFAVFAVEERRAGKSEPEARLGASALALAAGLASGAAMFYASFGFDFGVQWRFLNDYRHVTSTGETYSAALMHHMRTAFGYFPLWLQRSVWITLGTAWLVTVAAIRWQPQSRRAVYTYVLPPAVVWTLYLLSNGKYTNYHQGYAILHHVMFVWTAAAIFWVTCENMGRRHAFRAAALGTLLAVVVLWQGVRQFERQATGPPRAKQAEHRVAFSDYAERVLGPIPAGSTAWGSVFFGIESPDRVQLIQQDDAVTTLQRLDSAQRAEHVPDFLIWGYPEIRDETMAALAGSPTRVAAIDELLPGQRFRLASLVEGKPYGVTRVYARTTGGAQVDADRAEPAVAVYDDVHRHWLTRVGPSLPVEFRAASPLALRIGYQSEPPERTASATVAAELPPGHYWLKVSVRSGAGSAARLLAVTSATMTRQTIDDLSIRPAGDFAGYLTGRHDVFALSTHPGGVLYVSQFDRSEGAAIESVTIAPIVGLLDPGEHDPLSTPLPDFTRWMPMPGVGMILRSGRLHVEGDASPAGYQLFSPVIPVTPGERVDVDVPSTVAAGRVCVGILNGAGAWLVAAEAWREQLDFRADATGGFRVTFANCQYLGEPKPSRFELSGGAYVRGSAAWYADRLTRAGLDRVSPEEPTDPPRPVRFPDQPRIVITPSNMSHRAASVRGTTEAWTVDGRIDPADAVLIRARPRFLDTETRVLVGGRLDRGALAIGLIRNGEWTGRLRVTDAGEFAVLLAPPASGAYEVAIAGDPTAGPVLTASFNRVDLLPVVRPAK